MLPLLSHHPFNPHGLLRWDGRGRITDSALSLLFLYDGLTIADPLVEVRQAAQRGDDVAAVRLFRRLLRMYAVVEPLFEAGLLAVEHARPTVESADRAAVLSHFGLDPSMTAFTNFEEAFAGSDAFSPSGQHMLMRRSEELLQLLGLPSERFRSLGAAHAAVRSAAQALLHLSWQIAVCNEDPEVDLVLLGNTEEILFRELVNESDLVSSESVRSTTKTDLVGIASLGDIPHFDSLDLTIDDAIAIRRDDSFERFRDHLRGALHENQSVVVRNRVDREQALVRFEEQMDSAARELSAGVGTSTFRHHARAQALPAGVAIVASSIAAGVTEAGSGGLAVAVGAGVSAAVSSIAQVLNGWIGGRRGEQPNAIAVRYAATLGTPRVVPAIKNQSSKRARRFG